MTLQSCRIGCKWFRGKFGNGAHIALQPNRSPNKSKLFDQSNILISSIRIWSSINNEYLFRGISFLLHHRKGIMKWQFSWLAIILFTFPSHWTIISSLILQFNFLILQSGWTKLCNICQIFSYIIWITSTFLGYWIPGICCSFKYSASFSAYSQPLCNIRHYIP